MTPEKRKEYNDTYRKRNMDRLLLMRYNYEKKGMKRLNIEEIASLFKRKHDAENYLWLVEHNVL